MLLNKYSWLGRQVAEKGRCILRFGSVLVFSVSFSLIGAPLLWAQKADDSTKSSSGGYPYRIVIPPTTTACEPPQDGNDYSIEKLISLLEHYTQWTPFQSAMIKVLSSCQIPVVVDAHHPVIVALIHKGNAHYALLPQKSTPYATTLLGVSTVSIVVLLGEKENQALSKADVLLTSTRVDDPLMGQIPDLVKTIAAAQIGGASKLGIDRRQTIRGVGGGGTTISWPKFAAIVALNVPLPFNRGSVRETGTITLNKLKEDGTVDTNEDGTPKTEDVNINVTYTNKPLSHLDFTATAGAFVGNLHGAEKMKVDNGKYASDPLPRGITMAAVAIHPWAYDSSLPKMSASERIAILVGGVLTPAPGFGAAFSVGIVRNLAVHVGWAFIWIPTSADGSKPGAAVALTDHQLSYSWAGGLLVGGGYVFGK